MRTRPIPRLLILALVAAACGGGEADTPEAAELRYTLEPGAGLEYEVTLDQHIDVTAVGDPSLLGEEVPVDMSVDVSGVTTLTHTVAEGSAPGTYEVTIRGDFSDLSFDGTVDGEPIDPDELPDLAVIEPVDATIVVDEHGNVVSSGDELFSDPFATGLSNLSDLAGAALDPGRFVGPPLPDHEVAVGDVWSKTIDIPTFMDDDEITTEVVSEATGTDTVDGADVLVIETASTTSKIEMDMTELILGMFKSFSESEASEEELAELEAIEEDLRFAFTLDESTANMTTWLDPTAGRARKAERRGSGHVVVDINVPDEAAGGMIEFRVEMSVDQLIKFRLLGDVQG